MKPGYKQTEVGVIPEEWEVKRLGDVATFYKGKGLPKSELSESGAEPCIHYGELFTRYPETIREIFSRTDTSEVVFRSVANDVLMPTSDVTPRGLAKASCVRIDDVILGGDILVIRSDTHRVHGPFLSLVIRYEETQVLQLVTGSTVYHLYGSDMKNFTFFMPSLPEQTAIATALSDVDGLLGGLDRLIAKKRDLKQAAMQQLLTGQTRLPGFHAEWRVKTFGEVAVPRRERIDPRRAGVHDFCIELEHIESGSGQIMGSTSTGAQSSLKSVFHPGDVLFGKLRAYLRKYWRATRHGVCSTEIWVLVPRGDGATSEFLFQIVQTEGFIDAASNSYGTHMPRSDWNAVQNYELKMPPLPEQTAIASVLTEMDGELAVLTQRREKTRALKQAMMQELLTGKTRLI